MDGRSWCILFLVVIPAISGSWKSPPENRKDLRELRRGLHYHSKRHMLPIDAEPKRRITTPRSREMRKKPSGHLKPLEEDDIENDEVVSVAIGPPPIRPKYDRIDKKHNLRPFNDTIPVNTTAIATNLVKNIFTQLGREFLFQQVNENFIFAQYIGNAMRNLTSDLRLKMQHDILDLVVKYQKINRGETVKLDKMDEKPLPTLKELKAEKKLSSNDTEDTWPDFTNLARIVG